MKRAGGQHRMDSTSISEATPLSELREDFLATSTRSVPLAGLICWAALGIAALILPSRTIGTLGLYIMGAILPLSFLIERLEGRNPFSGGTDNPLWKLFFVSIVGIALTVPLVIAAAASSGDPTILVLGMAVLAGVIWIPYGWAAGDPVGVRHAVARGVGCYLIFNLSHEQYRATAVCAVVALAYVYSLVRMKKPLVIS